MPLWFIKRVALCLAYLFKSSYRFRYANSHRLEKAYASKVGYALSLWHQNLWQCILASLYAKHVCLVSKSKDGSIPSFILEVYGQVTARGSSKKCQKDKGGKEAKLKVIQKMKEGIPSALTVDGPKGPAKVVKPGVIDIARHSGGAIIPYIAVAKNYWQFNSWDKFKLGKPFTKVIVNYGEPLYVDKNVSGENFERVQNQLKQALDALEDETQDLWEDFDKLDPSGFIASRKG